MLCLLTILEDREVLWAKEERMGRPRLNPCVGPLDPASDGLLCLLLTLFTFTPSHTTNIDLLDMSGDSWVV